MPKLGIINEAAAHEALAVIIETANPDGAAPIVVGPDLHLALIRTDQVAVLRESSADALIRAAHELCASGDDDAADMVASFEVVCRLEARFGRHFRRLRHITGSPQAQAHQKGGDR